MVDVYGVIGTILGAAALLGTAYTIIKQRAFERQLNRKQSLREIADTLENISERIDRIVVNIKTPLKAPDMGFYLEDLGKEVLARYHEENEPQEVSISRFTIETGDDQSKIRDLQKAFEAIQRGGVANMHLSVGDDENQSIDFDISETFWALGFAHRDLDELDSEAKEVINEFDSDLISDYEDILYDINDKIIDRTHSVSGGESFHPDDYGNVDEIALAIYDKFVRYDEWEDDIESLEDIADRVESVRKTILQTSYS